MLKVKAGVKPANLIIAAAAANVSEELTLTIWITSGTDGKHMKTSLHYEGAALDFRISNLLKEDIKVFMMAMKRRLGARYDVILESDHIHVERNRDKNG
jgi:hypothetical protein